MGRLMRGVAIVFGIGMLALALLWVAEESHRAHVERAAVEHELPPTEPAEEQRAVDENATTEEGVVTLRVSDAETRKPVVGAVVAIQPSDDRFRSGPWERVRTDTTGQVRLRPEGRSFVEVFARGYLRIRFDCTTSQGEVWMTRVAASTLTVVDEFGQPIPHAVASPRVAPEIRFSADKYGRIRVRLGGSSVRVSAAGFVAADVILDQGRVVLFAGFVLGGQVVDRQGAPLAGAEIRIQDAYGSLRTHDEAPLRARTDANGRFLIRDIGGGHHDLDVECDGFRSANVRAAAGDTHVEISLVRPASISVELVTSGGRLVSDRVVLGRRSGFNFEWPPKPKEAWQRFEYLASGTHTLSVTHNELEFERTVDVLDGEHKHVRWVLSTEDGKRVVHSYVDVRVLHPAGHALKGAVVNDVSTDARGIARVVANPWISVEPPDELRDTLASENLDRRGAADSSTGQPLTVKLVALVPFDVEVVDAAGKPVDAEMQLIDEGSLVEGGPRWMVDPRKRYGVLVHAPEGGPAREFEDLPPGAHTVVIKRWGTVRGRVLDERNQPVQKARVVTLNHTVITGPDGRFVFKDLLPGKHLAAVNRRWFPEFERWFEFSGDTDVDLGDIVLHPPKTVKGRVTDSAGRPLGGVVITECRDLGDLVSTSTHPDGTFKMLVPTMTTALLFERTGHGADAVSVEAAKHVRLGPSGELVIHTDAPGTRLGFPQLDGTVVWAPWGLKKERSALRPGPVIIETFDEDENSERFERTIVAGETARVGAK